MLRLPGKLNTPAGWSVQAKLSIYLWLGIIQNKQFSYSGLPKGFDLSPEIRNAERRGALSPSNVHYIEKHVSLNNFCFSFSICYYIFRIFIHCSRHSNCVHMYIKQDH